MQGKQTLAVFLAVLATFLVIVGGAGSLRFLTDNQGKTVGTMPTAAPAAAAAEPTPETMHLKAAGAIKTNTAFPQQAVTFKSQAKKPSATKFLGQYYMHRPPSGNFFEMTWMFQDTSCQHYSLELGPQFNQVNTEGFFVVNGSVVGSTLRVAASEKADEARSEQASNILSKCPIPEGAILKR
jgi:hypothetical protein